MRRAWVGPAIIGIALFGGFFALRRAIGLEFGPESLRSVVDGLGIWAPLAFVGIVAFRLPLGLPSALVLIGGGLVFGTVAGTLYGALGLVTSAVVLFISARWAGREAVAARVPLRLRPLLDVAGSRLGGVFIAVGTAYPMSPISSYHLAAGVTSMSLPVFLVAVALGSLGRAAIYTYFGASLLAADPTQLWLSSALLVAALALPLAFPGPRAWLFQATVRSQPSPTP